MKKMRWFVLGLCLFVAFSFTFGCQTGDPATPAEPGDEEITPSDAVHIRMVSYFPTHLPEMTVPNFFIDRVNEELSGKVSVELIGGPEVIAQSDQAEAVRSGTVDMVMAPGSGFVSLIPEIDALKLATITAMEERETGAYELWEELFAKQANVQYLWGWSSLDEKFTLYTKEKLESVNLSGMLIRSIPLYEPIIVGLGGTPVSVSQDEIHTAMDRGIINAFFQPFLGGHTLGWTEVANYFYKPGFYRAEVIGVLNLDVWNKLPADVQEAIIEISKETEQFAYEWENDFTNESIAEMQAMGMELVELSPSEAEKYRSVAYEEGWAKVKERAPDKYELLRELLTK